MPIETILLIAVFAAMFYFLMIRPARKQMAAQQELRNSLAVGTRVMLSSGLYGTIRHLGDRQAIVDLAPGVEVTVSKNAVTTIVKPEDEDFEYDDESAQVEAEVDSQAGILTEPDDLPEGIERPEAGPQINKGI
ncbi:preprotein translocase subunit YajC [Propionibacteriaceae bacterium G1746]|uniref:preprotein translocase subunit YajC n=1 Tax=Aestuariimicrobium sp. G57 TaxID=3418485 RepID=UPI003C296B85